MRLEVTRALPADEMPIVSVEWSDAPVLIMGSGEWGFVTNRCGGANFAS